MAKKEYESFSECYLRELKNKDSQKAIAGALVMTAPLILLVVLDKILHNDVFIISAIVYVCVTAVITLAYLFYIVNRKRK